ncbi:hypothetical protein ABPG74_014734 [Tetrahymena malaccensis]
MSIKSLKQIRLPEQIARSPNRSQKLINFNSPQSLEKKIITLKEIKSEKSIKLPSIISPRMPGTQRDFKNSPQVNKSQKFSINNKLESLLGQIDDTLKIETNFTRQISNSIDQKVQKISQHFKNRSISSKFEMEQVMFSNQEKQKVINLYNNSIKSHYTNTASGIVYFKKNILQKEQDFGF